MRDVTTTVQGLVVRFTNERGKNCCGIFLVQVVCWYIKGPPSHWDYQGIRVMIRLKVRVKVRVR